MTFHDFQDWLVHRRPTPLPVNLIMLNATDTPLAFRYNGVGVHFQTLNFQEIFPSNTFHLNIGMTLPLKIN